ncbi:MAG: DUF192 domain-containing protein [Candidatus Moranbacteria bacterium]|nr:DUF192 domain-containing protein [Candidatus Moranbacteria bacterium]
MKGRREWISPTRGKWTWWVGWIVFSILSFFLSLTHFVVQPPYPTRVVVGGIRYDIEVADTEEERSKGLGGRASMCRNCALLFVFPEKGRWAFWMKEMHFPIDIVWIAGDTVVDIERNIPASSTAVFRPDAESDRVLEVSGNSAAGLFKGDKVRYEYRFPVGMP